MAVLSLYEPVNCLKPVADDVWIVDGPVIHMALYGAGLPFTTRMTIVRLPGNRLWLHSPVAWSARLARQLEALGTVTHLVSPNRIHYAYIADWSAHYPEARCWASPGVRERASSQNISVSFSDDLGDRPPAEWHDTLDQLCFRGSSVMEEVVFLHRPSRTLILADLIENFDPGKVHWRLRWLLRLAGVVAPHGQAPLDYRFTFRGGKDQARASFQRMLQWQPERIVLAHGNWIDHDGTQALKRAFRWLG